MLFRSMDFYLAWQLSHVVDNSWLPLSMSVMSGLSMLNFILFFKKSSNFLTFVVLMSSMGFVFYLWMRDLVRESSFQGHHTMMVQSGLKWGLLWFLFSEVWFFFGIFWSFFHISVSPLTGAMNYWPYLGVETIPAFQVPLLNTVVLLMSGVTATLAHQEILKSLGTKWVAVSAMLGAYFLLLQSSEYYLCSFNISSSVFGSIFYFGTGFHGMHVCLGMIMLLISSFRVFFKIINSQHHFSLEFSLWYWHFVDVVWLFLFFFVYIWGS